MNTFASDTQFVELNDEQRMLVENVRRITQDFGHARYVERARAGERADELWFALAEAGFIGVGIPEEYGGSGGGVEDLALVLEEVAAQGCPLLNIVRVCICGTILARHATEEQKQLWLPSIADGSLRMAFAITEPDAGSNSHQIRTQAVPDGAGWRLRGTKYYTSGMDESQAVLVVARTGHDESTGRGRLSLFVLPTDAPGIETQPLLTELVMPENQFTVFFDDVRVEPGWLVGEEGRGLQQVFTGLNPERIVAAAQVSGIARYALDKATRYANDRTVWGGKPIGSHQAIAHPLAEAYASMQLARLAIQRAARIYDQGGDPAELANIANLAASDAAIKAVDRAIQTHGGNGLSREFGIADLWFTTRLHAIAPLSREMILNWVAQHSLGLPRSY